MSQLSLKTSDSETNPLAGIQVMTNVGLYKGQAVAIKSVPKLSRELTRDDLIELKEVLYYLASRLLNFFYAQLN